MVKRFLPGLTIGECEATPCDPQLSSEVADALWLELPGYHVVVNRTAHAGDLPRECS